MKSQTLRSKMYDLNLTSSYSRPRVSNDNPCSEALFRTVKYCPDWPTEGFNSLDEARGWVKDFTKRYNTQHRHSRIKFVTPVQRYVGEDKKILDAVQLYLKKSREMQEDGLNQHETGRPMGAVSLNPDCVENIG